MSSPPSASILTGPTSVLFPQKTVDEDKLTAITNLLTIASKPSKPNAPALVAALYAEKSPAVLEYICTHLARCDVKDLEFFVPQLCNLLLYRNEGSKSLERLIVDLCARSLHYGLLVHYFLDAALTDQVIDTVERCKELLSLFRMATISSSRDSEMSPVVRQYALFQIEAKKKRLSMPIISPPESRRNSVQNGGSPSRASSGVLQPVSITASEPTAATTQPQQTSQPATSPIISAFSSIAALASVSQSDMNPEPEPNTDATQQFTPQQYQAMKRQFIPQGTSVDPYNFNPLSETSAASQMDRSLRPRTSTIDFLRMSNAALKVCEELDKQQSGLIAAGSPLFTAIDALEHQAGRIRSVSAFPATDEAESAPIEQFRRRPAPIELAAETVKLWEAELLTRKYRHEFYHAQLEFFGALTGISSLLKSLNYNTKPQKNAALKVCLQQLNLEFSRGVYHIYNGVCHRIIRIPWKEAFTLNSREKVPYMLFIEVVSPDQEGLATTNELVSSHTSLWGIVSPTAESPRAENEEPKVTQLAQINVIDEWVMVGSDAPEDKPQPSVIDKVFGEIWAKRKERVRRASPVGSQKGWDLLSVIIKSGDDLRQEQLATQLITVIHDIFTQSGLPLWLRPYEVMSTSATGGYIETVHDAISLHTLKEELGEDPSLRNYFIRAYGEKTPRFIDAQRNFVESLAAYSLVCCTSPPNLWTPVLTRSDSCRSSFTDILQIKDRHNGNILIDRDGHLIHIDYGFMLSSSPGSLNFETAPFKLTIEFVEVMGGKNTQLFEYFKTLIVAGFLKLREHAQRIISLVEMMLPATKMACFAKGVGTVKELEDRFKLPLSDADATMFALELIEQSIGNWRTDSYDTYQRYFSGIAT